MPPDLPRRPPGEAARAARPPETGPARPDPTRPDSGSDEAAPAGPGPRPPGGSRAMPVGTVRPECRGLARAAVRLDGPRSPTSCGWPSPTSAPNGRGPR